MKSILPSWILPSALLCAVFLTLTAAFPKDPPLLLGTVGTAPYGFSNTRTGTISPIHSNKLMLKSGGVGVIVIFDALKPEEEIPFDDFQTLLICPNLDFKMSNLEGRLICSWGKPLSAEEKTIDFTEYDEILMEKIGVGNDALIFIKTLPITNE